MELNQTNNDLENNASNSVRAVDRAIDVLLCFSTATPALSMTQISEKTGIHKSTVHRLLATLENRNFLRRDPETGIYRIGFRLLQFSYLVQEDMNIRLLALPYMQQLVDEYRETVDLAILDNEEVMFIDVIESPQRVKLSSSPGQRLPAFGTASGKAILAWLPPQEAKSKLINYHLNFHAQVVPTLDAFLDDLKATRLRGYSIDCEGLEPGIHAVGAPIFGVKDTPIASLAIAGPAFRLSCEVMAEMGEKLVSVTKEITKQIKINLPNQ